MDKGEQLALAVGKRVAEELQNQIMERIDRGEYVSGAELRRVKDAMMAITRELGREPSLLSPASLQPLLDRIGVSRADYERAFEAVRKRAAAS